MLIAPRIRRTVHLLTVLAACAWTAGAYADVVLQLQPGIGNAFRPGSLVSVSARITGSYRATTGRIELTAHGRGRTTRFTRAINLHSGVMNLREWFVFPADDYAEPDAEVRVYAGDRVLAEEKIAGLLPIDVQAPAIVAITTDRGGYHQIERLGISLQRREFLLTSSRSYYYGYQSGASTPARVLYPSAAALPDTLWAYASIDAIVIGNVAGADLTDRQWDAIHEWVSAGGTAVVSGGPDLNRLQHPMLARMLPVDATGIASPASLPSVAYRYQSSPALAGAGIATGSLKPGASALCSEGAVPIVASMPLGAGRVVYTAFDLASPGARAWSGQAGFWQEFLGTQDTHGILTKRVRSAAESTYGGGTASLADALAGFSAGDAPSFTLIGLFLGAYIILLVPVNYLILKRRDKRELAWVTAPVIIVAFTTGAYAVGHSMKGSALHMRSVTVVEGRANSPDYTAMSLVTVFSPAQRRYDLSTPSRTDFVTGLAEASGRGFGAPTSSGELTVEHTERTTVKGALISMWDHRTFEFDRRVRLAGVVQATVSPLSGGKYVVRVRNGTPYRLRSATITVGGIGRPAGDLAPGEVRTVTLEGAAGSGPVSAPSGAAAAASTAAKLQTAVAAATGNQPRNGYGPMPSYGDEATVSLSTITAWIDEDLGQTRLDGEQPITGRATLLVTNMAGGHVRRAQVAPPGPMTTPNSSAFLNGQAYTHANAGRLKEALRTAKQALALAPNDPNILDTVGEMHQRLGQYKDAVFYFERSLRRQPKPGLTETHAKYGQSLVALGRRADGIRELRIAASNKQDPWGAKAQASLDQLPPSAAPKGRKP